MNGKSLHHAVDIKHGAVAGGDDLKVPYGAHIC